MGNPIFLLNVKLFSRLILRVKGYRRGILEGVGAVRKIDAVQECARDWICGERIESFRDGCFLGKCLHIV